ncbi:MAG: DNA mismatch repair protein MutS, partial [Polaribacter sp.]|nr:DNA mismatch repair protein MutS [Polaribacter sp.]
MKQYNAIKVKYPDAMLLFRVGDFYETFGEDAKKAAHVLGITLTKRGAGSETETALAGFPHHSINTYLPKLVKAGMRVAICDQLEDPKMTKTIVKRGVTELVTPGVALNDEVLQSKTNNFLAAVHFDKKQLGISFLDVSTGEYLVAQGNAEYIDKLLQNFNPSEVLVEKKNKQQFFELFENRFYTFYLEDWVFQPEYAQESLQNHFDVKSLKGFGIQDLETGIVAAGAILFYLSETQHKQVSHIQNISRIAEDNYVWMDRFTVRNLELYHGTSVNSVTLLDIIDATISPMGGRLLKRWLALPLKNKTEIDKRHETVNYLINSDDFFETVTYQIKQISDIERLISKVATGKASPREVVYLKNSLQAILPIKEAAEKSKNPSVKNIGKQLNNCADLIAKITETLFDDAPVNIIKGNAIASNVSQELDDLRAISNSGKEYLDNMLARETERTGISSLKIAFNNVFGYYIEVRNTHRDKVPSAWIRKQTLVNAERYITEELKEYETKILGAEEKIQVLEQEIFSKLIQYIIQFVQPIQQNANGIAQLDCLLSFAKTAIDSNYVRPILDETTDLEIKNGRHPVIEKQLPIGEEYIANDVVLNRNQQQIIMITGPNMSGKSA